MAALDQAQPAVRLRTDAEAKNVLIVRQALEGAVQQLAAEEAVVWDIKLAVSEACANVVKHAYDGRTGKVEVELWVDEVDRRATVLVRDFGAWLSHVRDGDTAGLGLPLMAAITRSFTIRRLDPGTEILLEFDLDRPSDDIERS